MTDIHLLDSSPAFDLGDNDTVILGAPEAQSKNFTSCLAVRFVRDFNSTTNTSDVTLVYSPVACLGNFTTAICEVRVYEQVQFGRLAPNVFIALPQIWYVWFTTNWLQILFLLTLVMLLVSSCITFQVSSSSTLPIAALAVKGK